MKYIKIILFLFFISGNAIGANNNQTQSNDVNFSSDELKVDEKTKVMVASGNVVITNNNRQITADKVEYDQNLDKAIATGNVILKEKDGSIYTSESVVLTNEFKSVVAIPLYGELNDKSYIKATSLKKIDSGESYFKEGVYTACECDFKKIQNLYGG